MSVNVLIFTDCHNDNLFLRGTGSYRVATEIRNAGYTCQIIDFFGFMSSKDLKAIIEKYVGIDTYAIGFGSTFITMSIFSDYLEPNLPLEQHILKRRNLTEVVTPLFNIYNAHYPFDDHIIKKMIIDPCKEKNPNIKFIYGGVEAARQDAPFIDCFFYTFNDRNIIDYLDKLKNNLPLPTSYPLISNYPNFDFNKSQTLWHESDHIFHGETLPLEISRGCIFKCKFCSYPFTGKKQLDYIKDPGILREELIRNYELYSTTSYVLTDDTFNDSTYKLELLYNEVTSKLPFNITFSCFLRLDLINAHREQVQLLKDLGMKYCYFGIESITPETQRIIGKSNSISKIETIIPIIKDVWKKDILTTGSFILGLPGESPESYDFYKKWLVNESLDYFDFPSVNPLRINLSKKIDPIYKSDIDIDYEKYGYESCPRSGVSENWYYKPLDLELKDIALHTKQIRDVIHNDDRCRLGGLWAISLYSLGYSHEFIANTPARIATKIILDNINLYADKVRTYKNNILK